MIVDRIGNKILEKVLQQDGAASTTGIDLQTICALVSAIKGVSVIRTDSMI